MAREDDSKYAVGFGKPPKHTQFKPGQSGNPNGRPKKGTTAAEVALRQVRKSVIIKVAGKLKKVSMLEAIVTQHAVKAAKGDPKSTAIVLSLLRPFESDNDSKLPELIREFREKNARQVATNRTRDRATEDDGSNRCNE